MGRPVILGNGSLTVGLNEQGMVNDFYYPYVGLDNLNTSRSMHHRIGVWCGGVFSWVDDGFWNITVDFESDALVSSVTMRNDGLGVALHFNDFVDSDVNAFCRRITISNLSDSEQEIRLFMHQVFQISRAGRADTALYVPEENYVLDYKGRCSLLIYGEDEEGVPYDQFSIGNFGIEGKEGTYKDAEDGVLSGNAVEHGGVDSVIRYSCTLRGGSSRSFNYWIVAADSQYTAEGIHHQLKDDGLNKRLELTRDFWHDWLKTGLKNLTTKNERYATAVKKSLMVIKAHTDKRGGIIASCDSSIYNYGRDYYSYVWPRDGAYAMWPLIKLGYTEEPKRFFEFCRDILTREGYLMHKYQPDRAIGSTWHPLLHGRHKELAIQEDETAIVVFMIGEYLRYSHDQDFVFSLYNTFIQPASNFLAEFIDDETHLPHASYDLWEEKFLTNTYTTATTYAALNVAANLAEAFDYPDDVVKWRDAAKMIEAHTHAFFDEKRTSLRKGFLLQDDGTVSNDDTLDVSSLYGALRFGLLKPDQTFVAGSVQAVETILLNQSPSGGTPRYEHDRYFEQDSQYMGNPWFVTTLWMAQYYAGIGHKNKAQYYIDWSLDKTVPSGVLSEQIHPVTSEPLSVTPLVWSHAEVINSVLALAD